MNAYSVPGYSTNEDLDVINNLASTVPVNGIIVEIGSLFGRTAVAWAESAPNATVYCIDYFDDHLHFDPKLIDDFWKLNKVYNKESEFKKNTSSYKNIIPLKLDKGKHVYPYQGSKIDVLFLDGNHRNPVDWEIIVYFEKFLKSNSVICGHDYSKYFSDVIANVLALEKMYNTKVNLYNNSTMWSIQVNREV